MQKIIFIFIINLIFFSCSINKDKTKVEKEHITQDIDKMNMNSKSYESSIAKWNKAKKEHNHSYTYTVGFSSFSGYRTTTIITVKEGEVIKRAFYETYPTNLLNLPNQKTADKPTFIEDKTNLNTHNEGNPAITIDQLYKDCSDKYLTADKNKNVIHFKVDKIGILNVCGYTPKNCADDCFKGVSIGEIKWSI